MSIDPDRGIPSKEPPGCEPQTHWETRLLFMEYALQELVIKIGQAVPAAQEPLLQWCRDWTKQRDEIREAFRTDR